MVDMKYRYWSEKLMSAARTLATSPLPMKERLLAAFTHSLITLDATNAPDAQLLADFKKIQSQVNRTPSASEGSLKATIQQMSDDELQEVAAWIFDTFLDVERRWLEAT